MSPDMGCFRHALIAPLDANHSTFIFHPMDIRAMLHIPDKRAENQYGTPLRAPANGSSCSNGTRFRIGDIERAVLEALELDFLSPAALHRAADLAMEFFDKQQTADPQTMPAWSAAL